jgi:hypothetical protein
MIGRWRREEDGAATTEFGILAPVLVLLTAIFLEIVFMTVAYIQVGEAARRGSREAIIREQIPNLSGLTEGTAITCKRTEGTVTCTNASVLHGETYDQVLGVMQQILPNLEASNVRIEYRHGGIGDPDALNGIIPMITVRIINYEHEFLLAGLIPGAPEKIGLPSVSVTFMGSGRAVSE